MKNTYSSSSLAYRLICGFWLAVAVIGLICALFVNPYQFVTVALALALFAIAAVYGADDDEDDNDNGAVS